MARPRFGLLDLEMTNFLATTSTFPIAVGKVDRVVTIQLLEDLITGSKSGTGNPSAVATLPGDLWPLLSTSGTLIRFPWYISDNGTPQIGVMQISNAGAITFLKADASAWTAAASTRIRAGCATYIAASAIR